MNVNALKAAFNREPALWLAAISATVSLLVTFGWDSLTPEQGALWVAGITAVFAVIKAVLTRPFVPAAFSGLGVAVFALLSGYHFNVSPETTASVNVLVLTLLALVTRAQVSPTTGPVAPMEGDAAPAL